MIGGVRAFGRGLILPSPITAEAHPEFSLVTGMVALDGDGKGSPVATPHNVPLNISSYLTSLDSYAEFSPSRRGLRGLAFGVNPTEQQNITKRFEDGSELSLYREGWVTLSGLPIEGSRSNIEHRQEELHRIVADLWPDLRIGLPAAHGQEPRLAFVETTAVFPDAFRLDWTRSAPEKHIREFLTGLDRTGSNKRTSNVEDVQR